MHEQQLYVDRPVESLLFLEFLFIFCFQFVSNLQITLCKPFKYRLKVEVTAEWELFYDHINRPIMF